MKLCFFAALVWDEIQFVGQNLVCIPEKSEECFWTRNLERQDMTDAWCIYLDFANKHTTILVGNYESAMEKFTADYTGLFKMIVGVQLSSGNSAPNSGNNHNLTIQFEGCIHSSRDRVRVYHGTEGTNQNRHWNHHSWHATNSLERTRLSCWCL